MNSPDPEDATVVVHDCLHVHRNLRHVRDSAFFPVMIDDVMTNNWHTNRLSVDIIRVKANWPCTDLMLCAMNMPCRNSKTTLDQSKTSYFVHYYFNIWLFRLSWKYNNARLHITREHILQRTVNWMKIIKEINTCINLAILFTYMCSCVGIIGLRGSKKALGRDIRPPILNATAWKKLFNSYRDPCQSFCKWNNCFKTLRFHYITVIQHILNQIWLGLFQ